MPLERVYRLMDHAAFAALPESAPGGRLVRALAAGWLTEDEAAARFGAGRTTADWARFYAFFEELVQRGLLQVQTRWDGDALFTLTPAPSESACRTTPRPNAWRLSRFAYVRQDGGRLVLESPLTPHRCVLHEPGLAGLLFGPGHAASLGLAEPAADAFVQAAAWLKFIDAEDGEAEPAALGWWEFHDLLFHVRSMVGGHSQRVGGSCRFRGERDLPPVVRPAGRGEVIALPRPNDEAMRRLRRGLWDVLAERRSVRRHGAPAIRVDELAACLYAAARVKDVIEVDGIGQLSRRPWASGGSLHPLEVWPLARDCQGLAPGLYHYRADAHALEKFAVAADAFARLLGMCEFEGLGYGAPQVLLLITARFGRTAWKYEGLAYRLVQQDLGGLEQTLYLAATALDLAPCALGAVAPGTFASATGIDPYAEPLVGAFALGRPRSQSEAP